MRGKIDQRAGSGVGGRTVNHRTVNHRTVALIDTGKEMVICVRVR